MSLKNLFLSYVELQRSANETKIGFGIEDAKTTAAYDKANAVKRELLEKLEVADSIAIVRHLTK